METPRILVVLCVGGAASEPHRETQQWVGSLAVLAAYEQAPPTADHAQPEPRAQVVGAKPRVHMDPVPRGEGTISPDSEAVFTLAFSTSGWRGLCCPGLWELISALWLYTHTLSHPLGNHKPTCYRATLPLQPGVAGQWGGNTFLPLLILVAQVFLGSWKAHTNLCLWLHMAVPPGSPFLCGPVSCLTGTAFLHCDCI